MFSVRHFREKRMMLEKEIDFALHKALDMYYYEDAKEEFITLVDVVPNRSFKDFAESISIPSFEKKTLDSLWVVENNQSYKKPIASYNIVKGKAQADSILQLTNKGNTMYLPMPKNSIQLESLQKRLMHELSIKSINFDYKLVFTALDSVPTYVHFGIESSFEDSIQARNVFLPASSTLKLYYTIPAKFILKKGASQLALSIMLSLFIIGCIIYLTKALEQYKRNIEIRNDFVSNISHEFKTPIAIVFTALEAIKNFNFDQNLEKHLKYISIAQENMQQLNNLTEKILETTSLENETLQLQFTSVSMIPWLSKIIGKYKNEHPHKDIYLTHTDEHIWADIEPFYFSTALNNIIDNAVKYGGENIDIRISSNTKEMSIEVIDDGKGIPKNESLRIFEKYYRIPTGNIQDIRGYGLGLYHARKIVENHGGTLVLVNSHPPTFKISLPYE
jgi:two-component system phosphate regulon sensor histidine kinase PhoR